VTREIDLTGGEGGVSLTVSFEKPRGILPTILGLKPQVFIYDNDSRPGQPYEFHLGWGQKQEFVVPLSYSGNYFKPGPRAIWSVQVLPSGYPTRGPLTWLLNYWPWMLTEIEVTGEGRIVSYYEDIGHANLVSMDPMYYALPVGGVAGEMKVECRVKCDLEYDYLWEY